MDSRLEAMGKGIELENKMIELFSEVGWDCSRDTGLCGFAWDITLKKNGKRYGYVETYICENTKSAVTILKKKAEKIVRCVEIEKPELFVLTDGNAFENYIDGKYYMTTSIPIGYYEFSKIKDSVK